MKRTKPVELTLIERDINIGVNANDAPGFYYMRVGDKAQIIGVGCLLSIKQIDALKSLGYRMRCMERKLPVVSDTTTGEHHAGRVFTSYEFDRAIGAFIPKKAHEYTWHLVNVEKAVVIAMFFIFAVNALKDALHYDSLSTPLLAAAALWTFVVGIVLFRLRVSLSYTTKHPIGLV